MRHAVIMAGGAGTRLWPLSRKRRPKHFLRLIDNKSLMRLSYERLAAFLPPENIYVITGADHIDLVAEELPELPRENLIGEPAVRDTANAVGLSAAILHQRDPDGVMGIFTADHLIKPIDKFTQALERAYQAAVDYPETLGTLGICPRSPHTGYGYVRRGKQLSDTVFEVQEFREKPDLETARQYVESSEYFWNSGMFVWRIGAILDQLKKHLPSNYEQLMRISDAAEHERAALMSEIYPKLEKISIDFGVMEKADRVLVTAMDCDWLDVGAWTSLVDLLGQDDDGHVVGHKSLINIDSRNCVFIGEDDHLIATIGVEDLVVVRSADATLICRKDQVQQIKKLVGMLPDSYR